MSGASGGANPLDRGVFLLRLARAREHLRASRYEEAREELKFPLLTHPDDEELLHLLAAIEFKRGDYREAARAAAALVEKNPGSSVLHANLGLILFKSGELSQAEQELRRATELDPEHSRAHMTLGLLHRMRGEPTLALAHLRRAGARRLAAQVEEELGLSLEDAPAAAPAPASPAPPPGPEPDAAGSGRVLLAAVPPSPEPEPEARDLEPEDRSLFLARADGSLEIASRGTVLVRKGSVVWYSGRVRFTEEPAFRGTGLERLLVAYGRGDLFVREPGRHALARELSGQALFLEGSRVLALDPALSFRLEPIHDFRTHRRMDVLKVRGRGVAVLSVAADPVAHDVSAGSPLSVSSRDLVAWTGDLAASVLDDRFLEEIMAPDPSNAPKIRFEGEGVVLTEPPSS